MVFSETTPFLYAPSNSISLGEENEWLVYVVTHILTKQSDVAPLALILSINHHLTVVTSVPNPCVVARPLIFQVYSRRCTGFASAWSPYPSENVDFPIALCKGTHTFKFRYSIANFVSYDRLSSTSRSLIAFLDSIFVPKIVKGGFEPSRIF